VDLDPFFVAVERSFDPALRGQPVVVGGDGRGFGFVAAASEEARGTGVRVGMPLAQARTLCPAAAFRRGDLEAYGRVSDEVTAVLLAASRRVERPSADEAFVDLTPEEADAGAPVRAVETIRDALQRRLGLDASLGLASSRLAARIASGWARPRGLLIVLPGYEASFLAPRPLSNLELPTPLEAALERAGLTTIGQLAECDGPALQAIVGPLAPRIRAAARGEDEPPIALATPPASVQEEAIVRDRRSDRAVLLGVAETLARRAARRLKPFRVLAGAMTVDVRRTSGSARGGRALRPPASGEDTLAAIAHTLAEPLLEPANGVRVIQVRLWQLERPSSQATLFPEAAARREAR
jgi:DNA polymerase-4